MTRILITGAGGFIGSHAVRFFSRAGLDVRAHSRSRGLGDNSISGSLMDADSIDAACDGVSAVFHAAGLAHVRGVDPAEIERINVQWPALFAARAEKKNIPFLFLSSSKVYGESGHFSEASPRRPFDAYARAKARAEELLEGFPNCLIFRPPPVYGPGGKGSFRALIEACRRGWPLPVASIHSRRSYVYIDNLLSAIDHFRKKGQAGIWNISDDSDISLSDLTLAIGRASGKPVRSLAVPPAILRALLSVRPGLYQKLAGEFTLDVARQKQSGFKPPFSMEAALRQTLASA